MALSDVIAVLRADTSQFTAKIDQATGTTLDERCQIYLSGDVAANALAASFPELAGLAAVDDVAVKGWCKQPSGALQVPGP